MHPHSIVQYNFYKHGLSTLDRDIQENTIIREMVIAKEDNFSQIKLRFFRKMEAEGKLICIYCQIDLKIYTGITKNFPSDMVTLEHLVPLSQGGLKYHESNFACACSGCNGQRAVAPIFKITDTHYIW